LLKDTGHTVYKQQKSSFSEVIVHCHWQKDRK
jgi:hypothetical protein